MLRLWRRWIAYPLWWLAAVGLVLGYFWVTSGWGSTEPDMESFDARYVATLRTEQVSLEVTETIVARLQDNRGIIRTLIPAYDGASIGISGLRAVDQNGEEWPVRKSVLKNGDWQYRIGDPNRRLTGTYTFVLTYRIANAMVAGPDRQELYLNVNGLEWPNGFRSVKATLELDEVLQQSRLGEAACYTGPAGSRTRCAIEGFASAYVVEPVAVGPYEGVTFAVGFADGLVSHPLPPVQAASWGWWGIASLPAIGLLVLGIAAVARMRARNLTRSSSAIVTEFTPPEGITPLAAADFLGRPEMGHAAHLAWLVVRGNATITDQRVSAPAPGPGRDALSSAERDKLGEQLKVTWTREPDLGSNRLEAITSALLGDVGRPRSLNDVRTRASRTDLSGSRAKYLDGLGLRKESRLAPRLLLCGMIALVASGVVQVVQGLAGLGWWFLGAGVLGVLLVVAGVYIAPTHGGLTQRGKRVLNHLMGLNRFVTMSEANRIAWLQNAQDAPTKKDAVHLYEPLLPYAIIFGVEDSWRRLVGDVWNAFPKAALPAIGLIAATTATKQRRLSSSTEDSWWDTRENFGSGGLAFGLRDIKDSMASYSSGRSSSSTSTRSSGRGWDGGSSTSSGGSWGSSSSGSSGGGSSGGGIGGGGGGRW